ncbi:hypothetical protein JW898_04600 [Candidatus Woesearchaeota archaeon]|nr:hypothetical protein [Candidatus Woesearchaeota archaeon]
MTAELKEVDKLLSLINQHMLYYFLEKNAVPQEGQAPRNVLDFEGALILHDLETLVDEESRGLFAYDRDDKVIDPVAAPKILKHAIDAAEVGGFDFSIKVLNTLKEQLVRYQQEVLLQRTSSHLGSMSNILRSAVVELGSYRAFIPKQSEEWGEKEVLRYIDEFRKVLKRGRPDKLDYYFDEVFQVIVRNNDLRTGAALMDLLNERVLYWCMTPSGIPRLVEPVQRFGDFQYGYARLLLELEEIAVRLVNVKNDPNKLLVMVFKDDYAESTRAEVERLKQLRREVGSQELIERVNNGDTSIPNIIMQVASLGPKHLDVAIGYTGILASKVRSAVFGERRKVKEYEPQKKYVLVIEPRQFVTCSHDQLRKMGVSEDTMAAFEDTSWGILSKYLLIRDSPPYYSGRGEMIDVIDFYKGETEVPPALVKGFRSGRQGTPEFRKCLEGTKIPDTFYQVSIAYDINVEHGNVIDSWVRINDVTGLPETEVCIKKGNLGMHGRISDIAAGNAMVTREELDGIVRKHI